MSAENHTRDQNARASQRTKPSTWNFVYFLLAAFDVVTVCGGLYLSHRIMDIYTRSVEVNRIWAERVAAYSHLGELGADVNAPGNDVFDNRNVQKEAARMRLAEKAFDLELAKQRREMQANLAPRVAQPLLALLDAIAAAKDEMSDEATRIFDYFRQGRADKAGERMATMDQKYANLNTALVQLRLAVGAIQQQHFKEQTAAASQYARYQYVIGLFIVLMVLGATLYGHRIARRMQSDAEERERHVNALREAEARTRSILDTAAEGIVTFDRQGRIESFNQAAERLFGQSPGEAIGRDIRSMIPSLAGCMDLGADASGASAQSDPLILGGESTGKRRDGTVFPLELSVSTINLGGVPAYTGIVRDLSDRRKAEEAISLAASAQAASRAKSQFLANMSHEIRTPMNGVLGMAEMLLDSELTPTQRRFAEGVHRSGQALLEIIDEILDFSKIEAGKLELECVDFRPRELTEEVTQLLFENARKKGLEFVCSVEEDVPQVLRGAPSRLRQVLINLVGNAIKFTDRGCVAIKVSKLDAGASDQTGAFDYVAASSGAATVLHFAVADTGIGIAQAVQQRLFQAFTQADSSTTRRYGGTGLGLAISKELVEKMGGRIGVRSALGQGAEFWFTVRLGAALRPGPVPAPGANDADQASDLSGVRVLLAEDNPINQDVARTMLNSLGCQVYLVDNGAKALAAVANSQFDVVLMDCQMPQMDGFDATAEIRARRILRPKQASGNAEPVRLPIIGLTANALKGDREICIAAGMDDYLAKPFRRDALRLVLERWVLDQVPAQADREEREDGTPLCTFDRRILDQAGVNQRPGAPRIVAGLIDSYFADAARLIETICRSFEESDASALAHAAHSLSVGSDFVGARKLARLSGELERAGLAGEIAGLEQRIVGIRQEYKAVQLAVEAVRDGAETAYRPE